MPFSIAGPASTALPSLDGINRATDRISSGLRIDYQQNSAEAAITGRFDSAAGENTISIRNAINQISALQKADQTLGQGTELVERIAALSVQADNGALGKSEQSTLYNEMQGLLDQFAEDLAGAEFNGNPLFGSDGLDVEALEQKLDELRSGDEINSDQANELQSEISRLQASIGADQNAIASQVDSLESKGLAIASSQSDLSDADLAIEIVNLIQEQINFEASVKVFNHQRMAEESILNLLS
jgi:flagellin